jgi:light-regulated signal transduction histidine kinase (bacteriophytochrome)
MTAGTAEAMAQAHRRDATEAGASLMPGDTAETGDRMREFTRQLERSNRELQDFAYVASHDLQEPLRKIEVFADRIKARCGDALGEEGSDYLERMQKAASRMRTLIQDLLAFSRVTTQARPFVRVDLAAVAREVISDLEARIEQTGGTVELGELPTLDADPTQMRQLLQNLVGNALKFHRDAEPPTVRIYSAPIDASALGTEEGAGGLSAYHYVVALPVTCHATC